MFDKLVLANARERKAFLAGYKEGFSDFLTMDEDVERAWQQYRCQDETDWRAVRGVLADPGRV